MADEVVSFEVYRASDGARYQLVGDQAENVFEGLQKEGFVKVGVNAPDVDAEVPEEISAEDTPEVPQDVTPDVQASPAPEQSFKFIPKNPA